MRRPTHLIDRWKDEEKRKISNEAETPGAAKNRTFHENHFQCEILPITRNVRRSTGPGCTLTSDDGLRLLEYVSRSNDA
jgi:hypothetical protein